MFRNWKRSGRRSMAARRLGDWGEIYSATPLPTERLCGGLSVATRRLLERIAEDARAGRPITTLRPVRKVEAGRSRQCADTAVGVAPRIR
jgi:hypothetical protein